MRSIFYVQTLPDYRVIGLKLDVSFTSIEEIPMLIEQSIQRKKELVDIKEPHVRYGLSYHTRPDGFVYYSAFHVSEEQEVPPGFVELVIPEMTYLVTAHEGGSIEATYMQVNEWLESSKYVPYTSNDQSYYDALPIKHEKYETDADRFEIRIPIINKNYKKVLR
ncbi:GyrI-like domain-containing protein [Geomicrobium sp. JSM 1781026]|uniref:GyrI-like domain-containing protein n=1 Tax=unclassified Geomicrobium TaxID=2628951 RepID=UPI0005A8C924|nr:GyrI-like domain-containing protein [Geomicrobium sp. JCM 19037]